MKKVFTKILSITLFLLINVLLINNSLIVKANEQNELYQEISRNETVVMNDVVWTNIIANTKTTMPKGWDSGYGSNTPIDVNTWYGQQINVFTVPRVLDADGNQKYEIVAWSMQGDEQWDFKGMTLMAQDFEKKNPDYIVIGGINGDFYDWHTTKDYPNSGMGMEMQNGELIRPYRGGNEAVGFKNNNDADQIVYASNTVNHFSANPYLTIYNADGSVLKEIELNGMNLSSLEDGETSAYFPSLEIVYLYDDKGNHVPNSYGEPTIKERIFHAPTLAEGNSYYVIDGDKVIYQANDNSYYGKGKITNVNDGTEMVKNSFAVVTKNQELLSLLQKDVTIRVQYKITDPELSQSQNIMGSGHVLMKDGAFARYYVEEEYYTTRAPRTIIGCKADGTVCLLTMDGRQPDLNYYGTNQEEINTILTELGIDDAYLLDGGGSSTFFVRENEGFIVKNSPSDGQQRSVSNGFLIVTKKDNSVKIKDVEKTTSTLTFELDLEAMSDNITKSYMTLNGVKKEFVNGKVTFENLVSNTEYKYSLSYDTEQYKNIPTTTFSSATTLKKEPVITLGDITQDDKYFYPTFTVDDPDRAILILEIVLVDKATSKDISDDAYDRDEPDRVIKLKKSSGEKQYDCVIRYCYRSGTGQKLVELELKYDMSIFDKPVEQPDDNKDPIQNEEPEKKGCKSGFVVVTPLIGACALILLKTRKHD